MAAVSMKALLWVVLFTSVTRFLWTATEQRRSWYNDRQPTNYTSSSLLSLNTASRSCFDMKSGLWRRRTDAAEPMYPASTRKTPRSGQRHCPFLSSTGKCSPQLFSLQAHHRSRCVYETPLPSDVPVSRIAGMACLCHEEVSWRVLDDPYHRTPLLTFFLSGESGRYKYILTL